MMSGWKHSWFALYHDLIAQGLHVIHKQTYLRTQTKNAERERAKFTKAGVPNPHTRLPISYRGIGVKAHGSVLAAMIQNAKGYGLDYATADFTLPVPPHWYAAGGCADCAMATGQADHGVPAVDRAPGIVAAF